MELSLGYWDAFLGRVAWTRNEADLPKPTHKETSQAMYIEVFFIL